MALLTFNDIGISGVAAAVPKQVLDNLASNEWFTEKEAKSVVKMTGIRERRIVSPDVCASDLCYAAADVLLNDTNTDRSTIDVLIFISQTPDFRMPATGFILQDRLGLGKQCIVMDINLGCSGYVYGLALAYSYCLQSSIRNVLLLNGETRTKVYSFKDKSTGLLFGDAGAATLIEKKEKSGSSYFSLNADGERSSYIMIKSGGYRNMSSVESLTDKQFEDGSIRNDEQGIMDGAGVFDFTIQDIPRDIEKVLLSSGNKLEDIDYFLLHQANKFITDHIARKMGIPAEKVPYSLQKFGNTSSVSIPLNMVSELREHLSSGCHKMLLTGFGVGLSWGTAIISTNQIHVSELQEI